MCIMREAILAYIVTLELAMLAGAVALPEQFMPAHPPKSQIPTYLYCALM
jgi:hypothetical protein